MGGPVDTASSRFVPAGTESAEVSSTVVEDPDEPLESSLESDSPSPGSVVLVAFDRRIPL